MNEKCDEREIVLREKKVFETYDYIRFYEFIEEIEKLKQIKSVNEPAIRIQRHRGGLNSLWFGWSEYETDEEYSERLKQTEKKRMDEYEKMKRMIYNNPNMAKEIIKRWNKQNRYSD